MLHWQIKQIMTRELFVEENRGAVRRRKNARNSSIRKKINESVGFKKRRRNRNDEVYRDMVS